MKVVITGGLGFLGLRLARAIDALGTLETPSGPQAVEQIVLFDHVSSDVDTSGFRTEVQTVIGDISDKTTVAALLEDDGRTTSVFHLASVVSGQGEQDFDLAMRVNLDGGRHILEGLRAHAAMPRLVFASSIVVFGGAELIAHVDDLTKQLPQTTYGATKAICELLINDYSRKGFLDGRTARLPTIVIRPGKPNAAASSFASGIFREPLQGIDTVVPVGRDVSMPISGYRKIVQDLIDFHNVSADQLGSDRAYGMPSRTVTVADMERAVLAMADRRTLGQIHFEPDATIDGIIRTWACDASTNRAQSLGLGPAPDLPEIIADFVEDYL